MFNIDAKPIFKTPVKFKMVDPASGEKLSLDATFDALSDEEIKTFDLSTADGSKAFLRRVLRNLEGLTDAGGNAVTMTPEIRDRLLELQWLRGALGVAYFDGVNGAREGN